jgi:hypothetical protein
MGEGDAHGGHVVPSAYAQRGDLVGCTATLPHSERSHASSSQPKRTRHLVIPSEANPATSSSRPKRKRSGGILLFAWIAAEKLRDGDASVE